jgi:hypothetical protein
MKERARELKAAGRDRSAATEDDAAAVFAKIAEMSATTGPCGPSRSL